MADRLTIRDERRFTRYANSIPGMNIRKVLLDIHSKSEALMIVDYIGGDRQRFGELMSVFFEGNYGLMQRASWPISRCAERWPELVHPYLERLIEQLRRADVQNATKRNVVRLLQYIDIPPKLQGKVYSYCVDLVDDVGEPIAVRAFALTVAAKIALHEPDLKNELRLIVEQHLEHTSAAFHKRAQALF